MTRQTSQDTVANRAANANATVINNASDEALLANIIDPLIGCTPFQAPSIDNPGVMSSALALSEIQANQLQAAPIGLVVCIRLRLVPTRMISNIHFNSP